MSKDKKDSPSRSFLFGAGVMLAGFLADRVFRACNLNNVRNVMWVVIEGKQAWVEGIRRPVMETVPELPKNEERDFRTYDNPGPPPPPPEEEAFLNFAKATMQPGQAVPLASDEVEYMEAVRQRILDEGSMDIIDGAEPWPQL